MVRTYLLLFLLTGLFLADSAWAQFRFGGQTTEKKFELSYSNPGEYEIGGIEVTGVTSLDASSIIAVSGLKIGDQIRVPGDQISGAVKKLWEQGILGDVQVLVTKVEGNFIFLELRLKERPRLSKFGFRERKGKQVQNMRKTEADEMKEKLNLIRGRVVTDALIRNSEFKIQNYYREKGFMNVNVETTQEPDPVLKNSVVVNFTVEKGRKVKIHEIFVVGSGKVPEGVVRRSMKKTNEKIRISLGKNLNRDLLKLDTLKFGHVYRRFRDLQLNEVGTYLARNIKLNVFGNSKFNRSEFENDKDLIVSKYQSLGFRDGAVLWDSLKQISPYDVDIYLGVDEGNRFYHRNIIWKGNYLYPDKTLDKVLGVKKGDIYNKANLDKRLNFNPQGLDVSSLYMDDGYLFFQVNPVEVSVVGDSIDLEMRVYEGSQATVNRISVSGNTVTSDEVILREIRTLPGFKFSRRDIIRTQTQLSQMGYFDPEQIGILPKPNPDDGTVDIDYTVVERPSNQIELSGGWGGVFGFIGSLGLTINNFSLRKFMSFKDWTPLPSGDGQRLSLRAQANGRQFQTYSISFTEPWLGGRKPNSFTVSLNHSRQNDITPQGQRIGFFNITGMTFGLGKRLTWPDDYFVLNNSISFLFYDFENSRQAIQLGRLTGQARNFNYTIGISRNSVDNPTYPRSGSFVGLSATFTPPYSLFQPESYLETLDRFEWIEFHKWMFDNTWYLNPVGNLVLSGRIHFGFLGQYNQGYGIGPFERFTLGGAGLGGQNFLLGTEVVGLRGYQDNTIEPYIQDPGGNTIRQDPGVVFNKYVLELRYPLSLNPAATIYGLTFLEAGNNYGTMAEFNPFKNYKAAGFGLRIFMPAFGLIGLDWAYGLDPPPGGTAISGSQFHFTIGQQIR